MPPYRSRPSFPHSCSSRDSGTKLLHETLHLAAQPGQLFTCLGNLPGAACGLFGNATDLGQAVIDCVSNCTLLFCSSCNLLVHACNGLQVASNFMLQTRRALHHYNTFIGMPANLLHH